MATQGGTLHPVVEDSEVLERLRREPWCFEFFQAVRLLERFIAGSEPVGRFAKPSTEVARFGAHNSLAFPASEIQALVWREGQLPFLRVNFMGLTGPLGMLPRYYTQLIIDRGRARDNALRDFLDIFNHRFISLFFRAWEKYRFPIGYERGGRDPFSGVLLDLLGLGTAGLANRQKVPDDALLFYTGLFAPHPRSAVALEQVLEDYFGVPVEIEQFAGAWFRLDADMQCSMSEGRRESERLGVGVVVGDEVWDEQSRVRIRMGPLTRRQYCDFLPSGTACGPLRDLVRLYAGLEVDFEVQLILQREEVPRVELGAEEESGPRLGWMTWMRGARMDRDPGETVFEL